jgi:hypothetical protein
MEQAFGGEDRRCADALFLPRLGGASLNLPTLQCEWRRADWRFEGVLTLAERNSICLNPCRWCP